MDEEGGKERERERECKYLLNFTQSLTVTDGQVVFDPIGILVGHNLLTLGGKKDEDVKKNVYLVICSDTC